MEDTKGTPTISIIGCAGRNHQEVKMTSDLYEKMYAKCKSTIKQLGFSMDKIHLVSGGSAWSDHLAIDLFLKYGKKGCQLTLHLPCAWNGNEFGKGSCGRTLNLLHESFSAKTNKRTLNEIKKAIARGAKVIQYSSFYERNIMVGKSNYLIAFTWNNLTSGGTKHTWVNAPTWTTKIHIPLSTL